MRASWLWAGLDARRRWRSLVVSALLLGLGVAASLAAVAGARRTTSAFDRFRQVTLDADALLSVDDRWTAADQQELARSELVEVVRAVTAVPLDADAMRFDPVGGVDTIELRVPADGGADIGAVRLVEGRAPDPTLAEVTLDERAARLLAKAPGDTVDLFGLERTLDCDPSADECGWRPASGPPVVASISGITRAPGDLLPTEHNSATVWGSATIGAQFGAANQIRLMEVRLRAGPSGNEDFRSWLDGRWGVMSPETPDAMVLHQELPSGVLVAGRLDVERNALMAFAAVAAVVAIVAALQAFGRHLDGTRRDQATLRSLGMSPRERTLGGVLLAFIVALGAATGGVLLAIALSPLLPRGFARSADPDLGLHVDVQALAGGALGFAVVFLVVAVLQCRGAARAVERPAPLGRPTATSRVVGTAALRPVPGTSLRLAFERGAHGRRMPLISSVLAGIAGVALVVAAVMLAGGLDRIGRDPTLYGQPWDLIGASEGLEAGPAQALVASSTPGVDAVSVLRIGSVVTLDGPASGRRHWAVSVEAVRGEFPLAVLEGRPPQGPDEGGAGAETMARMGVGIGDVVATAGADGQSQPLRIVGRVAVPTLEFDQSDVGLVLTPSGFDERVVPDDGSRSGVAIRTEAGWSRDDVRRALLDADVATDPRTAPTAVNNLVGAAGFPAAIAAFAALIGVVALGHLFVEIVRRRAGELAVLRSLGFTNRDVHGAVIGSGLSLAVAIVVGGVLAGIALGRLVWRAIADRHGVLDRPVLEPVVLVVVICGAVLLCLALVLPPALRSTRRSPGAALRVE